MFKKIILAMAICLMAMPVSASYASDGGFISETDAKILAHDFKWKIAVYKVDGGTKEKVYEETLDKPLVQKDGSYLSFSNKVAVLEPMTNTSSNIVIMRLTDIDVNGEKYSGTFTFKKNTYMSYIQYNDDKSIQVRLYARPNEETNTAQDKLRDIYY